MGNTLYCNSDEIETIISSLKDEVVSYDNSITKLENLVNSISSSSSWKDEDVKTSFINTCNSYIESYKFYKEGINNYISCLEKKINNIKNIENDYSS